jgi:hypothetical protein
MAGPRFTYSLQWTLVATTFVVVTDPVIMTWVLDIPHHLYYHLFFFFWWDWDLNSGFFTCKAGALLLESHIQSILLSLVWRWGSLTNYLPGLALNLSPPNLSLQSREV